MSLGTRQGSWGRANRPGKKFFGGGGVTPPLMYVAGPQNRDGQPTSRRALLPRVSSPLNWIPNAYGMSIIQFATICCRSSLPPLSVCFGMPTALGYDPGNDPVRDRKSVV